ncbi:hypothetical protein JXA80_05705 [bacterium]|nr:hypothetical protein [candidate division CSSED10-310 bacterium]
MVEDSLWIDIVYGRDLTITEKDTIINIVTHEGLQEALVRHDRFAPHHEAVLNRALDLGSFRGNAGDVLLDIPDTCGRHVHLYIGLGSRKELNPRAYQNAGANMARRLSNMNIHSVVLDLAVPQGLDPYDSIKPFVEGVAIGSYTFSKYFRKREPFPLGKMTVVIPDYMDERAARQAMTHAADNIHASNLARHLTNEASNNKTPALFETMVLENLTDTCLSVRTLHEAELELEKLNLLRAVGQAGSDTPRLMIIEDFKPERTFNLGIIGKAITFDAGGLMLKSPESLPHMRDDVAGAAAVIGAMSVIRDLNLDYNIVCAIPIAENMLDSKAYRPADVFSTRWDISVEVTNTDSEGRLILADAMMYLQDHYDLNLMLDVATLTGAVSRALGNQLAGYFTNDERLVRLLADSQQRSREKFWRLPLEQSYRKLLRSSFADIKNEGGEPKAITAALFLETFVKKQMPWLHIDIGSMIAPSPDDPLYGNPDYTTGIPAMTLIEFFRLVDVHKNQFPNV